ncbi:MAG: polymer-forming cytoskeletal protein [Pseudomonadota bacterium]
MPQHDASGFGNPSQCARQVPCNHRPVVADLKRRISDRTNGSPTVLAEGATFTGDLIVPGALVLSGTVKGDGDIGGTLSIARGARWEGQVRARSAVVAGELIGSLTIADRLEVGAAAVLKGRVSARILAIARGAVIEGDILVTSGEPIIEFEEKREPALA